MNKIVIGITLGDPSGIGPETVMHALTDEAVDERIQPVIFGDEAVIDQALNVTGLELSFQKIEAASVRRYTGTEIPFIPTGIMKEPAIHGTIDNDCGRAAFVALHTCIDAALHNQIDAMTTAPVKKESLKLAGCRELDQTTILYKKTGSEQLETFLINGRLRIFFLTRNLALQAVFKSITIENLLHSVRQCEHCLKQLGIIKPAIAVAALNQHGGEDGLLGSEELEIMRPAIEILQRELRDVRGPIPADAVFHQAAAGKFDGVLALYHDQGCIAAKTLDFYKTITVTMGLPFLVTSVGHGTAFDIAGKGIANPQNMIEALLFAADHHKAAGEDVDSLEEDR